MTVPVKLVYSAAPIDSSFSEQLSAHLHALVQGGFLSEWHEHHIPAGAEVTQERHRAWQSADILLLLLSVDYFLSPVYDDQEMQQALERYQSGQLLIIPILLRPCDWQSSV